REMIASDEGDTWALAELTTLREQAGDHAEVFKLLVRRAELAGEAAAVLKLRHQAAVVAREKLADSEKAIELYEQIFEGEASDSEASTALRGLYASAKKHKELLALLSRLTDLAETPEARSALRFESARICIDHLDATAEATEHLRAILDEQPSHEEATLLL